MNHTQIPKSMYEFLYSNYSLPIGLIGCRSVNPDLAMNCCEYNCVTFSKTGQIKSLHHVDKDIVTVKSINLTSIDSLLISSMSIIIDNKHFLLSSLKKRVDKNKTCKIFKTVGRKHLLKSFLYYLKIKDYLNKDNVLASILFRIFLHEFLESTLYLSQRFPSPLHQLNQIKDTLENIRSNDGIRIALETIGIERASKTTLIRISNGISQLCENEYPRSVLQTKTQHLIKEGKYPECYYYLSRIGTKFLDTKDIGYIINSKKAIQLALDLDTDTIKIEKTNTEIALSIKILLKNLM